MQLGLKTRILVGFLAIVVVFAGASLFTVSRMHGIRDDLRLIHRGYLTMNRLATQVRTLQEAKDEYVRRALAERDPRLRRHLVAYARTFYPRAMRDRLLEIDRLSTSLEQGLSNEEDLAYLREVTELTARGSRLHDSYDEATAALLGSLDDESLGEDARAARLQAYTEAGDALGREVQTLGLRTEAKLFETVLRAERDEREAAFAAILLSVIASLVGGGVVWAIGRGLRPLSVLLESARSIGRGSLDVEVSAEGPEEVAALGREFNAMARALRDRERALASHNEDLSRLKVFSDDVIRSVQVGIVVLDAEGRVRTFNPAARSVLSLPLIDVEGRGFAELGRLEGPLSEVMNAVEEVRRTGRPRQFTGVHVGGKIVDIGLVPIRDRAGASSSDVLLLGEDVTEREEARTRLVESERLAAIGRLAAQITHEIRNPLSSIGLNIDLLADDVPLLPDGRQHEAQAILDAVGGEVERLSHITEGYLRYARLPTGRREPGDVGDLLADLAAFSQGEAEKAGVMLELQVEEGLPLVAHDPPRLRQALLNLLRNALEAAGRGGTVRLSAVSGEESGVRLLVEDSGPGLDDEARARIFEPFFTTKPQGTGLGLTLAQQIVREHGGTLAARQSTLGGASFEIALGAPPSGEAPETAAA